MCPTNRWTGATGSVFRSRLGPAQLLGNAVARSTQPLGGQRSLNNPMRGGITSAVAIAVLSSGITCATYSQSKPAQRTVAVHFPTLAGPQDAGISLVRIVITCGRVSSVTRIPDDWYVRTLRPATESEPEWQEFRFAENAVDFEAGHGVTRLRDLKSLGGAVRVAVEDERCFDIVVDIKDDMTEGGWHVRLHKSQLQLRNHHSVSAPPNKSLDASRASVFRMKLD